MFELMESSQQENNAVIKVVGVGGGGGNAVEHMVAENIDGVEFICANTDAQALRGSSAKIHIQLGDALTKGLGAGANPQIGREAAEEDREHIKEILSGADMVFITAGMGGGTGTGAAPVFAEIAKELGILTVAVVTKPFSFEGKQRALAAEEGIRRLAEHVDSLITIPNNKLLSVLGKNISLLNAFKAANNVLLGAVKGISDLITRPGLINVDFADVRTVMSEMGMAMMGTGSAVGEQRARQAAEAAIASPLLEDVNFSGARGILVNITAGLDMSIGEFEEVGDVVKEFISDDATVVVGTVIDPEMTDEMRVTVIVTGLGDNRQRQQQPQQPLRARLVETTRSDGSLDYQQLERPAVIRKQAQTGTGTTATKQTNNGNENVPDVDYLDIPAFLRRQEEA
ncbi:TPA: cell division protein FtsZ [Legionella pneumophila subsp. pneumophila]|uniref:Cell division protein FtsZ n=2 Tax=Legionella pneumophila TaxID=446 RepID=A0A4T1E6M6_LEGPN|nr:cell division protein FtsZ [Legionella pneumophila]AOW53627.1 cell division protein FtsZ [Legionella pneumophila subsp. pneumophila]AOW55480.1 cell division protein FtsZ [Legionella pneumophila subsp. pneumophila]AOW64425.1 cell division protein FtsZ [Legionella pneumophila subsp. pneumophila]MDC8030681.1 cell division protein FtsZ [Legionella pneumophila subsp. pneumophila]MDW8870468.1 cell division protein FtsZ [Legionella pneumophila]